MIFGLGHLVVRVCCLRVLWFDSVFYVCAWFDVNS